MPDMWLIQGVRAVQTPDGWRSVEQVPTFYLHPDVQGTQTASQAQRVAERIIGKGAQVTVALVNPDEPVTGLGSCRCRRRRR